MSVLCRNIKTLFQHNLPSSAVSELCRDINFFVATKLFVFQPFSMLQHKFEMSQHKIHYCDILLFYPLHLLSRPLAFQLCYNILAMLRHTFVVVLNLCRDNKFFCRDRVSYCCISLLSRQTFSLSRHIFFFDPCRWLDCLL